MLRARLAAAFAVLFTALPAAAQTYPSKAVHLIVAYAPGGTGDVVARIIAEKLGPALGQNVVVENRAGASGAIGATAVVNAPPDGHMLLVGQTGEIVVNQYWMKGLTYDPKNLMPVALATVVPLALTVPAKTPYASMAEMFNAIKTSGKPFSFASAGTGTPGHFAGEYLSAKMPGKLVHVPYKGAGPALNDIIGGHVDMYFPGFPPVMPMMKAGTVKVLAVSSGNALRRRAGNPDGRGGDRLCGLRLHALAGLLRAEGHAARRDRAAQRRDQQDPQRPRRAPEAHRCGRERDAADDRAVCRVREGGERQVRAHHPRDRRQAGLSAARPGRHSSSTSASATTDEASISTNAASYPPLASKIAAPA